MASKKTILLGGLAVIVAVGAVVGVRTATFAPKDIADGSDVISPAADAVLSR